MREVEKLANDLRGLCFHQIGAGELAEHLTRLGYLPVEPAQLEMLTQEKMLETLGYIKFNPAFADELKRISQATVAHNEAKGQLYRAKSGTIEDVIEGEVVND